MIDKKFLNGRYIPEYRTEYNFTYKKPYNEPGHRHEHYEFIYISLGECYYMLDGLQRQFHLTDGCFLLHDARYNHRLVVEEGKECGFVLNEVNFVQSERGIFLCDIVKSFPECELLFNNAFSYIKLEHCPEILTIMELIHNQFARDRCVQTRQTDILFYALFMEVARVYSRCRHRLPENNACVEYAKNYIESNFDRSFYIHDIAAALQIDVSYLHRIFKKETGMTPLDYLNRVRMERAVFLLKSTNFNIPVIARQTGILNSAYFSKLFKKTYGETPGKYRQRCNGGK